MPHKELTFIHKKLSAIDELETRLTEFGVLGPQLGFNPAD
jgi:hypothetical protein